MKSANFSERENQRNLDPGSPVNGDPDRAVGELTEEDHRVYLDLVDTRLSEEQANRVATPWREFPRQKEVLAVHWHPEYIPQELIARRIAGTFPNSDLELIIPTQHNRLMTWGDKAGVEIDCYAMGFNRKVQLLLHFKADRVREAAVLHSMLDHTFKYRVGQLFELMDSILSPVFQDRLDEAAGQTGANEDVVNWTRYYVARLKKLLEENESRTPEDMVKNKLIPEYLQTQRGRHPQNLINRSLLLVQAVKVIVKRLFASDYFFRASEVIEEVRGLGGGVVIPHPEQFWPILLADYDVDGWEVWNPQSQEYTQFLIAAMNNQNKIPRPGRKSILVFMGDDTHLSVKVRDPEGVERSKLEREVGWQPAWDDVGIRKGLSLTGASRRRIIEEYMERLA